jgi:Arc/MetJ-type ribon-helix-helix transcriptional regulator
VNIELDEKLVRLARNLVGAPESSDSEVVEAALTEVLGFAALEEAHQAGPLEPAATDALAVAEVRAHRAARRGSP